MLVIEFIKLKKCNSPNDIIKIQYYSEQILITLCPDTKTIKMISEKDWVTFSFLIYKNSKEIEKYRYGKLNLHIFLSFIYKYPYYTLEVNNFTISKITPGNKSIIIE